MEAARREEIQVLEFIMPRGDKSKYTSKQKRKAEHIEEGYRERGVPEEEAERRAWATVNATDRGGKKPGGSGRGKTTNKEPSRKGGKKGGRASAARSKAQRSASAKKAARTRKRKAASKKSS
jgi:hypothetical protein